MAAGSHVPALRRAFGGRPQQPRDAGAEGADAVSMLKLRAGLLGLLAMLLLGAFAAAPAFAEGGPFWHHREVGEENEGAKITEQAPEKIGGEGGEQKLKGKLAGTAIEIVAKSVQVKGEIYNNADQAQAKILLAYNQPTLTIPAASHCAVLVGTNNTVPVYAHQAWKWNGKIPQLAVGQQFEQERDWIVTPFNLSQQLPIKNEEVELPKEVFTTITLSSSGGTCLLAGKAPVEGSVGAEVLSLKGLEHWSREETQKTPGEQVKQHFWNGTRYVGVDLVLYFDKEPASLTGEFKLKTNKQEVALFEH